ncbi:unnamed protein product [Symbiodinium microadriaticum]|nr:unnamed protein product [Symbiodinium microadriaticum]
MWTIASAIEWSLIPCRAPSMENIIARQIVLSALPDHDSCIALTIEHVATLGDILCRMFGATLDGSLCPMIANCHDKLQYLKTTLALEIAMLHFLHGHHWQALCTLKRLWRKRCPLQLL